MSDIVEARNYFRRVLNPLGLTEWRDGFAFDNIPANIYDKAYHIGSGTISGGPANQCDQPTESSITLRLFFKGFRDVVEGVERALDIGEIVVKNTINVQNRTDSHPVKNVIFDGMEALPLDAVDNDNAIILEMEFTVLVILNPQDI